MEDNRSFGSRKNWTPTQSAFEKLLASFSNNRDEAAEQYELTRSKLIRFFERRSLRGSDRFADETLDRVMRRIDEGEVITNMMAYVYKVASYVVMEALRDEEKLRTNTDFATAAAFTDEEDKESPRTRCLDRCLDKLPIETRTLILDYYSKEGREKIQLRQQMAKRLGIRLNALRIRAHKIRVGLEQCVNACLDQAA